MTRQIIRPNRVALYLDTPELHDLGIQSENPDSEALHTLVLDVFENSGLTPEGGMAIEVFHGHGSLMVFAEFGAPLETRIFAFKDFEHLLSAIFSLSNPPGFSNLTYLNKLYYLEIRDFEEILPRAAAMLSEFGCAVSSDFSAFLTEHGECLLRGNAAVRLAEVFHQ